ncbi:NTP transferase domain-containing protein [Novosphingobium sp. FSY-8]|uniref:NTP transferase domain-containing protein n=1 Tax=Novosphingobium ovatum TaxID=1908523 RepID=A0ABW9X9G3_9SPHN|nr:nucleotidyltransferase family protein [Novosphingobium ovatum]NBC35176.1 NTP transferase domain-containing protein [Novosphingobium ovatum]
MNDAPAPAHDLTVVLLAAGASRRMEGADKRFLPIARADGGGYWPLLCHTLALYRGLGLPVVVVTPPESTPIAHAIATHFPDDTAIRLIANPAPSDDQGESARIGLSHVPAAALIALVDHPLLRPAHVAALIAHAGESAIVIPRHNGARGHPVLLGAAHVRAIRAAPALTPRQHIAAMGHDILWLDSPDPAYTTDIDTPADADRLIPGWRHAGQP